MRCQSLGSGSCFLWKPIITISGFAGTKPWKEHEKWPTWGATGQQGKTTALEALKYAPTVALVRCCRAVSKRQAAGLQTAEPQHYQECGIEALQVQSNTYLRIWAEMHQAQGATAMPLPPCTTQATACCWNKSQHHNTKSQTDVFSSRLPMGN